MSYQTSMVGYGADMTLRTRDGFERGTSDNPMAVVTSPPTALTGQGNGIVGTAAAILVPASATRRYLAIYNRSAGSVTIDLGAAGVTVGGGIPIPPGGGYVFDGAGAAGPIYGLAPSAGVAYSYVGS